MIKKINDQLGFSTSISAATIKIPSGACDSHMHVVGPAHEYPVRVQSIFTKPPTATLTDYQATVGELGLQRLVVVQPSFYGTDNSCTLDSVSAFGENARAVVIVSPDISHVEIEIMHKRGARGIRLQTVGKGGTLGNVPIEGMRQLAPKMQPFGWHFQLYVDASQLTEIAPDLQALGVPLVFDHMAHVLEDESTETPGFEALCAMLRSGVAWVKLSSAIFAGSPARAIKLFNANPDRALWGTDWPHVAFRESVPDDGKLLNDLGIWFPHENDRKKILSLNPAALYFDGT